MSKATQLCTHCQVRWYGFADETCWCCEQSTMTRLAWKKQLTLGEHYQYALPTTKLREELNVSSS